METKKRLEKIQNFLLQSGLPAHPSHLAQILGVSASSLSRWLGGDEAKGKQRTKIDILFRTVLKAEAGNLTATKLVAQFARPMAGGVGLLASGLTGVLTALGLNWILSDPDEEDNEE